MKSYGFVKEFFLLFFCLTITCHFNEYCSFNSMLFKKINRSLCKFYLE